LASADMLGPITTTTPIASSKTDWTGGLTFAKFNPMLGTLQSVTIKVSSAMDTILTITNDSPSSSSGSAKTELQVSVQDTGGNLNAPQIDLFSSSFTYNLASGQSVSSGHLLKNTTDEQTYTLQAILDEFTGSGSIVLPASTFTQTWLTNTGGNTFASQVTNASLTGEVTYTYSVPEPATMSLLGLGAVALLRKRRNRS